VNDGLKAKWTKDYFILHNEYGQYVNEIFTEHVNGTEYLLIENKGDEYSKTGVASDYFVFIRTDARKITYTTVINDQGFYTDEYDYYFYDDPSAYAEWEIAGGLKKDNLDKWTAGVLDISSGRYWLNSITFLPNGAMIMGLNPGYFNGNWTNGFFIYENDHGQTISEYFFVTVGGVEYLVMENKNGDYSREKSCNSFFVYTRKNG